MDMRDNDYDLEINADLLYQALSGLRVGNDGYLNRTAIYIERYLNAQSEYIAYVGHCVDDEQMPLDWENWLVMHNLRTVPE